MDQSRDGPPTPTQPAAPLARSVQQRLEVWEIETMDDLVGEAKAMNDRLDAISILSMADHRRSRNNAEAVSALNEARHITYSGVMIHSRVAWQESQAAGRAVFEMVRPDAKASAEVDAPITAAFQ